MHDDLCFITNATFKLIQHGVVAKLRVDYQTVIDALAEDFKQINIYNAHLYFSHKELRKLYFKRLLFKDFDNLQKDIDYIRSIVSNLVATGRNGRWPAYHNDEKCQALHAPYYDKEQQQMHPNSGTTHIFNPPTPALVKTEVMESFTELQDFYALNQEIIDPVKYQSNPQRHPTVFQRIHGTKEYAIQERYLQLKRQLFLHISRYYQAVYNPKLQFNKGILDAIGLHPCKQCVPL